MENHLSHTRTSERPEGFHNKLMYTSIFKVDFLRKWYPRLVEYVMSGRLLEDDVLFQTHDWVAEGHFASKLAGQKVH